MLGSTYIPETELHCDCEDNTDTELKTNSYIITLFNIRNAFQSTVSLNFQAQFYAF